MSIHPQTKGSTPLVNTTLWQSYDTRPQNTYPWLPCDTAAFCSFPVAWSPSSLFGQTLLLLGALLLIAFSIRLPPCFWSWAYISLSGPPDPATSTPGLSITACTLLAASGEGILFKVPLPLSFCLGGQS